MRRVVLILLALVLFAPSVARASAWYRCAHDGQTRTSCCCPPTAKHHKTPTSNTAIRAACCCSITQLAAAESSERAVSSLALDMAPAMVTVVAVAPIETPVRVAILDYSSPPRGPPESLFARSCSLLL
ncbi:MAG: hypothetical protein ABJE66_16745 [Deltaproteobacteria bacterium]